ncbi:hypothetical protein FRC01_000968, partial [Tulasnella sp. 417]
MLDSNSSLTVASTALAGAAVVGYYYAKKKSDSQQPPLVPYIIPWIGSAMAMSRDPDAFFKNARDKYGDIFTVQAAGARLTYVTSAAAILAIYRNSKSFVFTPIRLEISMRVFEMPRSIVYDNDYMKETLYPLHHRILASANVPPMVDALVKHTVDMVKEVRSRIPRMQWSTTLEEFAHKPIFRAIAASMFGPGFPAEKTNAFNTDPHYPNQAYDPFTVFDDYIPLLAAGAPSLFVQKGIRARTQLIDMFEEYLGNPGWEDGASELISAIVYGARNESQPPWTDREIAS